MRILWAAMFLSIGFYYLFTLFAGLPPTATPSSTLSLLFVVVGLFMIAASFLFKKIFLTKSVEQQRTDLVQQGYIVAFAIAEVPALLGILDFFATGNRYYFVPMIISALGQLLHFPRRQHVVDASFNRPTY
jgi:hypothetical protein